MVIRTGQVNWRTALDVAVSAALIACSVIVAWTVVASSRATAPPNRPSARMPLPNGPLTLDGALLLGNAATARIGILEFSDYECGACGRFTREIFPDLRRKYVDSGRMLFALRHFPMGNHDNAKVAAAAALCASSHGKFWQMHEELFDQSQPLEPAAILHRARKIGIDPREMGGCLNAPATLAAITRDIREAKEIRVPGTPTLILGFVDDGRRLVPKQVLFGLRPPEEMARLIDALLASTP